MCSRHPEEGAGAAYVDDPEYLAEWQQWAQTALEGSKYPAEVIDSEPVKVSTESGRGE